MSSIARGAMRGCYELTSFGTHLFFSELERHNADEYKSYERGELEYNPEYCPHYSWRHRLSYA